MMLLTKIVYACFCYALKSHVVGGHQVKVAIVGGGPAGLLTAHALCSRGIKLGNKYNVTLLESRENPKFTEPGPRAYSLGLNIRGQTALSYFDQPTRSEGLLEEIKKQSVQSDSFFLHIGKTKIQIRKAGKKGLPSEVPPTLLIARDKLCRAMLTTLEHRYTDLIQTGMLNVQFSTKVEDINVKSKKILLENGNHLPYDWLIGCDGVRSPVRYALNQLSSLESGGGGFYSEEVLLPGKYKVMVQPCPPAVESDAVHAMEGGKNLANALEKFGLFLIPSLNNTMCTIVNWRGDDTPKFLQDDADESFVKTTISSAYPLFGEPTDEAIVQLKSQKPSDVRTIRCNRYHDPTGSILLLGDAAHSTGGTLGQGANSALLDVVELDKCLEDSGDDILIASEQFSRKQVPEGLALWQLLQLPPKGIPGILYQLNQVLWGILSNIKFLKKFIPWTTQNSLSQSLKPFSQIVRENWFWIKLATKKYRNIQYSPTIATSPQ